MITAERIMEIIDEKIGFYEAGLAMIEKQGDVLKRRKQIKNRYDELLAIKGKILRESKGC